MKKVSKKDSPLPEGWVEALGQKADLELSFFGLRGIRHFYAEALRGRIRSYQLRFDAAWKHFDKAYTLSSKCEESIPNLVRQFLLNIWCFENALAESPIKDTVKEIPETFIPDLPEAVLAEYPEVRLVIRMRRRSEALLRLHLGQYSEAAEIFDSLIEENQDDQEDQLAFYYIGMAACEHNLGLKDDALKTLENAGLAVAAGTHTLNCGYNGAVLHAIYKYLEQGEQATSWEQFLERLPCPPATRDVFKKRAALLLERCTHGVSLVLL